MRVGCGIRSMDARRYADEGRHERHPDRRAEIRPPPAARNQAAGIRSRRAVAVRRRRERPGASLLDVVTTDELACELWLAATVQEENGLHGARALLRAERFDGAVAIDVGLVGDMPGVSEREYRTALGAGPIVVHRDTGIVYDRALTQHLIAMADRAGVAVQEAVFAGYMSDALALWESALPTALLTVPTLYTHTAFEAIHPADLEATVALLGALAAAGLPRRGEVGPDRA
jgi:tetrahedral aminopeptidase